ncbi:hypothetical protein DQ04_13961000, partial [Trypanosoma grayi]|uniref:hypothetical protein n=1 Tax=Trypanosoma grayi TaxID=71804 RepID=UPI0004F421D5
TSVPRAVMMAAVGRPALFVVAVVLCCVCGCAAATTEGIGGQGKEAVALELENARKKTVDAQKAVNDANNAVVAIKQATDKFKTAADNALNKATELNKKVEENKVAQQENPAKVASLANDILGATKASYESLGSLCDNVRQAVEATTNAETLFMAAQKTPRSAAKEVDEVIRKAENLAEDEFKKLSADLKKLSEGQKCSEEAKKAVTKEVNAFYAMKSAEEGLDFLKEITAKQTSIEIEKLKTAAKTATDVATAAVKGAAAALVDAIQASGHADKAVMSANSLLKDIDVALQAVTKREKEPEASPSDADSPSQDEAQGQSIPQEPLSSTSTGEKPSDQQEAGTAATDKEQSPSVPSEEKTAAESLENAASQAADAPLTPPKSD